MTNHELDKLVAGAKQAEKTLKVLSNYNRLLILCYLYSSSLTVKELSEKIKLSSSAVSQHLALMRKLNIVEYQKKGKNVLYILQNMHIKAIISTLYLIYCK